ncbi:MAG: sulfotransferase family protein [Desulfobacterales bacterium]|nr:sulfotransferase family protein [Desulfobacterales bacterium]
MTRFFRFSCSNYNNLKNNPKHKFAQNHSLNIYEVDAIYSFIPKNACSTLRTTIAHANGCIKEKSDFNWIHKNNNTFSANISELIKAKYTFTILRCPFARLVSVYLDKIVNRDPVAWNYIDLHKQKINMEDITFDFFVKSMRNPHIKNGNIHWRPQIDFLVYEEYDDFFSLENFSEAVKTIKEKLGIDVIDARPLTKHGLDGYAFLEEKNYYDLKPFELLNLKIKGSLPHPCKMYNDELIKIVRNTYKNDIQLYKKKIGPDNLMFK